MQNRRVLRHLLVPTAFLLALAPGLSALDVATEKDPPAADENVKKRDRELERLALRLADWEKSRAERSVDGLQIQAFLAPDALVYKAASTYLRLRDSGLTRDAALRSIGKSLPRWKRYEGASLLLLTMKNRNYEIGATSRRIYTQTKNLARDAIRVRVGKKTRLKAALGGVPRNLRLANLRIQKFWQTADGLTRRAIPRPRDELLRNPGSIGRKPKLGKPFKAVVLEKNPAEIELLLKKSYLKKSQRHNFLVELADWKVYDGPWGKNILDLNEQRTWEVVTGLDLEVSLPPGGWTVNPELEAVLQDARAPQKKPAPAKKKG